MTLLSVRQNFIKFAGRFDLVIDDVDWADNGANFFIRAGQRWLDRRSTHVKSKGISFIPLLTGAWYGIIPQARAVQKVYLSNVEKSRFKLEKVDSLELLEDFPSNPSDTTNGVPSRYFPTTIRNVPEASGSTIIARYGATIYTENVDNFSYNGLVWGVPVEAGMVLEVHGLFYQPLLFADLDKNVWSEEHEFILVLGACRALEVSYRNRQGVLDWETAIDSELLGLELDLIEEESSEITEFTG